MDTVQILKVHHQPRWGTDKTEKKIAEEQKQTDMGKKQRRKEKVDVKLR